MALLRARAPGPTIRASWLTGCSYARRNPLAHLAWPGIPLSALVLRPTGRGSVGGLAPRRVYRDHGMFERGYDEGV